MKRIYAGLAAVLMALFSACHGREAVPSSSPAAGQLSSSGPAQTPVTEEERERWNAFLQPLCDSGALLGDWEGNPPDTDPEKAGIVLEMAVSDASREGDVLTLQVELYGELYLDPDSMRDTFQITQTKILPSEDDPHYPNFKIGKAVVKLRETSGGAEPLSCAYESFPDSGVAFLKEQTRKAADQLEASQKLDTAQYDPYLLDYVWKKLLEKRYIQSPQDITLWDLENLLESLELNVYQWTEQPETVPEGYLIDAGLLRLCPNLRWLECQTPIKDYSVFEGMEHLEHLAFYGGCDFSTLRVGHTGALAVSGFDQDMAVDLTHVGADYLELQSWTSGVTGFTGCERLSSLVIQSTRTDMRLVNAETFPNLTSLNLDFYSETPRVRDLSRLAGFGDQVNIEVLLRYQACNDKTLESLAGVVLDSLTLVPHEGPYMWEDPDPALVERIPAKNIWWEKNEEESPAAV